jgi:hypothetical protein
MPRRRPDADLPAREATGTASRLIGIAAARCRRWRRPIREIAPTSRRRAATLAAIDALRRRYGDAAISRGRGWTRR